MTVAVDSDAADVQLITYTLHAPVGTSIIKVVYTGGPLQDKEQVLFYADRPANSYITDTVVTSASSDVSVLASTFLTGTFASVSGMTNEHLRLEFDSWAALFRVFTAGSWYSGALVRHVGAVFRPTNLLRCGTHALVRIE